MLIYLLYIAFITPSLISVYLPYPSLDFKSKSSIEIAERWRGGGLERAR